MTPIESLSPSRRLVLTLLKQDGPRTIAALAERMGTSGEAVRQQLLLLQREGWVRALRRPRRVDAGVAAGRPAALYTLTPAGEHLFPKNYDALSVSLIDAIQDTLGPEALWRVLGSLVDARVREWEPRLEGMSLEERLEALREIYLAEDPFTEVEKDAGGLRLVERNCPFLNTALSRPALCSVTVGALARLLGFRVVREERFQNGNRRCVFRIDHDAPLGGERKPFEFEPPLTGE